MPAQRRYLEPTRSVWNVKPVAVPVPGIEAPPATGSLAASNRSPCGTHVATPAAGTATCAHLPALPAPTAFPPVSCLSSSRRPPAQAKSSHRHGPHVPCPMSHVEICQSVFAFRRQSRLELIRPIPSGEPFFPAQPRPPSDAPNPVRPSLERPCLVRDPEAIVECIDAARGRAGA